MFIHPDLSVVSCRVKTRSATKEHDHVVLPGDTSVTVGTIRKVSEGVKTHGLWWVDGPEMSRVCCSFIESIFVYIDTAKLPNVSKRVIL